MHETLKKLENGLVVSCQTLAPLNDPHITGLMAQAAVMAGAHGIRACRPENIRAVRALVDVPIVGIFKQEHPGFDIYITPTIESALAAVDAGADIIGMDGSPRPRPDRSSFKDLVDAVHERGALVMADISTREEGLFCRRGGRRHCRLHPLRLHRAQRQDPRPGPRPGGHSSSRKPANRSTPKGATTPPKT